MRGWRETGTGCPSRKRGSKRAREIANFSHKRSLGGKIKAAEERGEGLNKEYVHARIEEVGIINAVRVNSAEQARYAAEALYRARIPIAAITITVHRAKQA